MQSDLADTLVELSAVFTRLEEWLSALQKIGFCNAIQLTSDIKALVNAYRTGKLVVVDDGAVERMARKFNLGDRVTKTKGSAWTGRVVGFYSTSLTPIGYAVESENEPGSVQIYPENALRAKGPGHEQ